LNPIFSINFCEDEKQNIHINFETNDDEELRNKLCGLFTQIGDPETFFIIMLEQLEKQSVETEDERLNTFFEIFYSKLEEHNSEKQRPFIDPSEVLSGLF